MRSDRVHPQHGGGDEDGRESETQDTGSRAGGTGREGEATVLKPTWFEPIDSVFDLMDEMGCKDGFCPMPTPKPKVVDMVNHPPHYVNDKKKIETIDKIEDAVQFAPNAVLGGLQWQVIKYIDRMWDKEDPKKDAKKAMWYLKRLIQKLEN